MPTILVTGAGGFIGAALVPALLACDFDVVAVDFDSWRLERLALLEQLAADSDTGRSSGRGNLRTFNSDIRDASEIAEVAASVRPAQIVHLAALHLIPECEAAPRRTVATNIKGLVNVLDAADAAGAQRLVFASTADVYRASGEAHTENDPPCPSTVYGTTKMLGERLVAEWSATRSGRHTTSVRIFNVYGSADPNPHVIPDILRRLRGGGELRVGNAEARRDFIHVDDVAELLCRVLISDDPPHLLNAGTGTAKSIAEILGILQQLLDQVFAWSTDSTMVRSVDRESLRADVSRLRSVFPGFEPRGIETGLGDVIRALDNPIGVV